MKIKVYSTKMCPYCNMAKEFLKEHNIKFEEIHVDEDKNAAREMIKLSGQTGVPVIEIRKLHSVEVIIGFDKEKIKRALKL